MTHLKLSGHIFRIFWTNLENLIYSFFKALRNDTHMVFMKIIEFSKSLPPSPLVHLRPKFFHPLDLGRPTSNEPPCPNDNQSIKRK